MGVEFGGDVVLCSDLLFGRRKKTVSLVLYMVYLLTLVTTYLHRGLVGQGLTLKEKVRRIAKLGLDVSFYSIQVAGQ